MPNGGVLTVLAELANSRSNIRFCNYHDVYNTSDLYLVFYYFSLGFRKLKRYQSMIAVNWGKNKMSVFNSKVTKNFSDVS